METILAATELGAGFRIAMKDLEIRGAGQLLGAEQSGHIHAVGFDLYQRLLSQAVEEVRTGGELPEPPEDEKREVSLNLGLPARIPQSYVEDLAARLDLYQRLSKAQTLEDVAQLQDEMWDRFGTPPKEVHSLLYTVRIRALATEAGVESVTREGRHVAVRLLDDVGGARPRVGARAGASRQGGPQADPHGDGGSGPPLGTGALGDAGGPGRLQRPCGLHHRVTRRSHAVSPRIRKLRIGTWLLYSLLSLHGNVYNAGE